jgi:hypothetical protein
MRKVLPWIFGIAIALILVSWLAFGRSDRQAYRAARGAVNQRVQISQDRIDMAVEMATKSVDLALMMAGNLPSQEAAADLVKQDIEEIGNRLKEAADAKGEAAMAKLDQSIEQFICTRTVDGANGEVSGQIDPGPYLQHLGRCEGAARSSGFEDSGITRGGMSAR